MILSTETTIIFCYAESVVSAQLYIYAHRRFRAADAFDLQRSKKAFAFDLQRLLLCNSCR